MNAKATGLPPGVSQKIDAVKAELIGLRRALSGQPVTNRWLMSVADQAWLLEEVAGATHFGGAEVLIWWLAEQVRKTNQAHQERAEEIRDARAQRHKLQFLATMERIAPHNIGFRIWDFMTVSSYLGQLCKERLGPGYQARLGVQ